MVPMQSVTPGTMQGLGREARAAQLPGSAATSVYQGSAPAMSQILYLWKELLKK